MAAPLCAYFNNKAICFVGPGYSPGEGEVMLAADDADHLSPAKLLKNPEINNTAYVVTDNPERAFEEFCSQFTAVEAAGGVVENSDGAILMMFRRGWWDLPKGHVEPGESREEAALREVAEETGLHGVERGPLITTTQHFYDTYGRWEMKRTWWYAMKYVGADAPVPQAEEGITDIKWLTGKEFWSAVMGTYTTIKNVLDLYIQGEGEW